MTITFSQPSSATRVDVLDESQQKGNRPYVKNYRYKLINPETGHPETWTRVTTFTKTIKDMKTLHDWDLRNTVKGIAMRPDLIALAASTPLEDRDTLNTIARTAQEVAGNKAAANNGTAMHSFADQVDRGLSPYIPDGWRQDIDAYSTGMAARQIKVVPHLIERYVAIPSLRLCGRIDRVLEWDGELVIGDMKTSANIGYGWGEMAMQLAIYASATHYWDEDADQWVAMPTIAQDIGIIANTLVGQARTDWYSLPLAQGFRGIELAQAVREWRGSKVPGSPIAPVAAFAGRLRAARDMPELIGVFSEAQSLGAWNAELDAIALEMQAKFS